MQPVEVETRARKMAVADQHAKEPAFDHMMQVIRRLNQFVEQHASKDAVHPIVGLPPQQRDAGAACIVVCAQSVENALPRRDDRKFVDGFHRRLRASAIDRILVRANAFQKPGGGPRLRLGTLGEARCVLNALAGRRGQRWTFAKESAKRLQHAHPSIVRTINH